MVIEVQNLHKTFKGMSLPWKKKKPVHALKGVSLQVNAGEVFGLLGPNGSGKTTLIRCMLGLVKPTSGQGSIFGYDIINQSRKVRKRTSLLPQEASCYENLTARENIIYAGGIHGKNKDYLEQKADELIDLIGLQDRQNSLTKEFSGGMKRKVLVAKALIMDPDLIFLDEPTTAIDILGARVIRNLIKKLSTELNKTVFLTTHDLAEVELCDRVGIMVNGELVAIGKPNELKDKFHAHGMEDVYTGLVTGEIDFE